MVWFSWNPVSVSTVGFFRGTFELNCEKSDGLTSYPQPLKVFCASVLCLVQKMTIYQLSLSLKLVQLWKVTVNALLVLSSLVTRLWNLHHNV